MLNTLLNRSHTCLGISKGALLSIEVEVAVSPFKYANNSFLSGRLTAGILAAYEHG